MGAYLPDPKNDMKINEEAVRVARLERLALLKAEITAKKDEIDSLQLEVAVTESGVAGSYDGVSREVGELQQQLQKVNHDINVMGGVYEYSVDPLPLPFNRMDASEYTNTMETHSKKIQEAYESNQTLDATIVTVIQRRMDDRTRAENNRVIVTERNALMKLLSTIVPIDANAHRMENLMLLNKRLDILQRLRPLENLKSMMEKNEGARRSSRRYCGV